MLNLLAGPSCHSVIMGWLQKILVFLIKVANCFKTPVIAMRYYSHEINQTKVKWTGTIVS